MDSNSPWVKVWIEHGQMVALAASVWWAIQLIAGFVLRQVWPISDQAVSADRNVRVVAFTHASMANILALYGLLQLGSPLHSDHIYGTTSLSWFCFTASSGFDGIPFEF